MKITTLTLENLMALDNAILAKLNLSSPTQNYEAFLSEVKKSVGKKKVSAEIMRELENENYHSMLQALIDLGLAPKHF